MLNHSALNDFNLNGCVDYSVAGSSWEFAGIYVVPQRRLRSLTPRRDLLIIELVSTCVRRRGGPCRQLLLGTHLLFLLCPFFSALPMGSTPLG